MRAEADWLAPMPMPSGGSAEPVAAGKTAILIVKVSNDCVTRFALRNDEFEEVHSCATS